MKQTEVKRAIRTISAYLVERLMKSQSLTRNDAVEMLMHTACYEALMDPETDLYLESKESVWDILIQEINGNPYRLLKI